MKERPILFSGDMVRAILEGRKTQTRRVMKRQPTAQPTLCHNVTNNAQPSWVSVLYIQGARMGSQIQTCPYGQPGDRLWVRETFCPDWASHGPIYKADGGSAIEAGYSREPRWTPSIHMPRKYSRITLEITAIRVERLQDISEDDARAEGVYQYKDGAWKIYTPTTSFGSDSAKRSFNTLWESINGAESWAANPWVWVIEFKRLA